VAAFAQVWTRDPSVIYHLNVDGAMNIINASFECDVRRIVITSTAGVFGYSEAGKQVDENTVAKEFFIHYEHSKAILENILQTLSHCSMDIVIVNPTRVYGPGQLSESNSVTKMISAFLTGKWRLIPGNGKASGNYVFIDDVVQGHVLAMEKGISGENYILGGEDSGYNDFFSRLETIKGRKHRMIKIPLPLMLLISQISIAWAYITRGNPVITPGLVRKFNHDFRVSSSKAIHHLGYKPIDLSEGLKATATWLENIKKDK
jgi:nucleoside-diphosphate-sugar epimerase